MSDTKLNQIFVLHSVKFVCEALKEHAKLADVSVYILDEPSNFKFFLDDLGPQIVIARDEDLKGKVDEFLAEFGPSSRIMKVLWMSKSESELEHLFDAVIKEPITPSTLFFELSALLESYIKSH